LGERERSFELDEATVTLPVPEEAEFSDLDGLDPGTRHLTWTAAPGAFFAISGGTSAGHTPEGMLKGEDLQVESDEPAPLAGPGARRIAFRVTRRRPREVEAERTVGPREVRQLSDLLFVPGKRQHLRIGYRMQEDVPEDVRALLARMLDRVEVRRRDAAA
jgi:hypothetical protein